MLAGPHTQRMTEQSVPIIMFFCFFLGGPLVGSNGLAHLPIEILVVDNSSRGPDSHTGSAKNALTGGETARKIRSSIRCREGQMCR